MKNIPRVMAIQDLSCFGRCSLSVIIPILSKMEIQVCPVPTAVFSTHTGGFGAPAMTDLTGMMHEFRKHWEELGVSFDCIYSGFLSNEHQIDEVLHFFQTFAESKETIIVVDPVMGDDGKLYSTYNEAMQQKMKELVARAKVITPNWTEASFLVHRPFSMEPVTREEIKEIIKKLSDIGPSQVVLKGIPYKDGEKVNAIYDKEIDTFELIHYEEIPKHYPGTGDCFTSRLIGELLQGRSLLEATKEATAFVRLGVQLTYEAGTAEREGILVEKLLNF